MEEGIPNECILWNSFDVVVMKTAVGRNKYLDISEINLLSLTLLKPKSLQDIYQIGDIGSFPAAAASQQVNKVCGLAGQNLFNLLCGCSICDSTNPTKGTRT